MPLPHPTLLVLGVVTNCVRSSRPGRQKALKSEDMWPCPCGQRTCHLLNHQELRILLKAQIQCKWSRVETDSCCLHCSPAAPRTGNYLLTKVTTFSGAASRQQHCPCLLADKCVPTIAAGKSVRPIAQATIPSIQGWWKPRLPTLTKPICLLEGEKITLRRTANFKTEVAFSLLWNI